MERLTEEKEVLVRSRRAGCSSVGRLVDRLVGIPRSCLIGLQVTFLLTVLVLLISCTTLKKAGVTSLGAGGGAIVGSVLSSGVAAPILGATTGAFVTDVVTEAMITKKASGTILQTEAGMIECAPDNIFSLLEKKLLGTIGISIKCSSVNGLSWKYCSLVNFSKSST